MSTHAPAVLLRIGTPAREIAVDEWTPLHFQVQRPTTSQSPLCLRNVSCRERGVELSPDVLVADIEIRPGETYHLTLPLRVKQPGGLDLRTIKLQVHDPDLPGSPRHLLSLDTEHCLTVRPNITGEVKVAVEPLCAYERGVKVQLSLDHQGATTFRDLTVRLEPADGVLTGKSTLHHATFAPGQKEQVEVLVDAGRLTVTLEAAAEGGPAQARLEFPIEPPPAAAERRFRFLEPRRLSVDTIRLTEVGDHPEPIAPVEGAYPLHGDRRYRLEITPQYPGMKEVHVRDIPNKVHVLSEDRPDPTHRCWRFVLDVSCADLVRQPEMLVYEMTADGEPLRGEVPVCIRPAPLRHWKVALALGIALTVQGLAVLGRFLTRILNERELGLDEVAGDFRLSSDYNLFFLFSIPAAWAGLTLWDWLQYRLQS